MSKSKQRPENLSFARSMNITEAKFWQTNWNIRNTAKSPLLLIDKAILSTKGHEMPEKNLEKEILDPNIHKGQVCTLSTEHDTLRVDYGIKFLSVKDCIYSCSDYEYRGLLNKLIDNYVERDGFITIAKRIVNNIANARFLWRNRKGAYAIETVVTIDDKEYVFNSKEFNLDIFVEDNDDINAIAEQVAAVFSGKEEFINISVVCFAKSGLSMEVYPSQELTVDTEEKGKKLFCFEGNAGMHSQKINNALRTIDTWYPDYDKYEFPIPIENYGAARSVGIAFRTQKHFYKLIDTVLLKGKDIEENDMHYVMAVLIRGGMFSKSSK